MKATVLIDGGYLRAVSKKAGHRYDPDFIESVSHNSLESGEILLRVLYYDCDPYAGTVNLPVSGNKREFHGSGWLKRLASKDRFAVRRGSLKFRGFVPNRVPINPSSLTDADFSPQFEQKGVDMRLGLDIAVHAMNRTVDRIILISGDTDCLPAMKFARTAGLQIILIGLPGEHIAQELFWHSDIFREINWPNPRTP